MTINELSYKIRGAAFKVNTELGPGLLESVYECALEYELNKLALKVEKQKGIAVEYKNVKMELGFRMDLLVEDKVIIEIKSVEELNDIHKKQLLTYLKLSDKKLGLLINFNSNSLNKSIIRIIN